MELSHEQSRKIKALSNNYHPSNSSPLIFADVLVIMQFCNRVNNTDCWYAYAEYLEDLAYYVNKSTNND